jgi:hypothetical protein
LTCSNRDVSSWTLKENHWPKTCYLRSSTPILYPKRWMMTFYLTTIVAFSIPINLCRIYWSVKKSHHRILSKLHCLCRRKRLCKMQMYIILRYGRSLLRRLLIRKGKMIKVIEGIRPVFLKEYPKTSLKSNTNKKQKQG